MENCLHEIYLHQIPYRKYPTYILGMENSLQENFLQLFRTGFFYRFQKTQGRKNSRLKKLKAIFQPKTQRFGDF